MVVGRISEKHNRELVLRVLNGRLCFQLLEHHRPTDRLTLRGESCAALVELLHEAERVLSAGAESTYI